MKLKVELDLDDPANTFLLYVDDVLMGMIARFELEIAEGEPHHAFRLLLDRVTLEGSDRSHADAAMDRVLERLRKLTELSDDGKLPGDTIIELVETFAQ